MGYHMIRREPIAPLNPARELAKGLTWFALISKHSREYLAALWLEELHGPRTTLVPLTTRQRAKGARGGKNEQRKEYQVPLIPRIVFAGFAHRPNWLAMWDSFHIAGAVGLNGTPSPIPVSQIEIFRSTTDPDRIAAGLPVLKIGSTARFVGEGMFYGRVLNIEALGPRNATGWLELFGGRVKATIAREDLDAV